VIEGVLAPFLALRAAWSGERAPSDPFELPALLVGSLDRCVQRLASDLDPTRLAIVAVGGYGRGELCLQSDVDLMLLGEAASTQARSIFYPFWNAHLKVGHSVRTVREAIGGAAENLQTLCSLISARLVWGSEPAFSDMRAGLATLLRRQRASLGELLAEEERLVRLAEPFFLQEPVLKTGRGGLRSLHRIDWMRRRTDLLTDSISSDPLPNERRQLLAVRNALHAIQGSPRDRYAIDLREAVGRWLGREPMEVCFETYAAIRRIDDLAWEEWGDPPPLGADPVVAAGRWLMGAVRGRWLGSTGRSRTPLRAALETLRAPEVGRLQNGLELGPWAASDRDALVELLANGSRGWWAFRQLESVGWVKEVLPEIAKTVALPQRAPFHSHPVDSHLWRTVHEVVSLTSGGDPWCGELAEELGSLDELLLAAWLHDIGKAFPGSHAEVGARVATALLERLGFEGGTVELVGRAVLLHLLLFRTATRADLDDPAVIRRVGEEVGDGRMLALLSILTVADGRATSVWSEWTETLLRTLVARVRGHLEGVEPEDEAISDPILAAHVAAMPDGYLRRFGLEMASHHAHLAEPAPGDGEVRLEAFASSSLPSVVAVARDRPGLLAMIAGVLSLHNLNVLEARISTRKDGVAIDTFRVEDALGTGAVGIARWTRVRADLAAAARGELDLAERLQKRNPATGAPAEVEIDTARSMVTVRTSDRVGLLHDLAAALARLGLDIHLAKVTTRGGQAIDVFGLGAHSVPPTRLKEALLSAIAGD
jgi:[protein-PII] uridylyltransferase